MSNHGWIRLKARLLNVHVKSWLNTLKDKVAKCTCQIMVEYAKEKVAKWLNTLKDKVAKCTCQIMVEYA